MPLHVAEEAGDVEDVEMWCCPRKEVMVLKRAKEKNKRFPNVFHFVVRFTFGGSNLLGLELAGTPKLGPLQVDENRSVDPLNPHAAVGLLNTENNFSYVRHKPCKESDDVRCDDTIPFRCISVRMGTGFSQTLRACPDFGAPGHRSFRGVHLRFGSSVLGARCFLHRWRPRS